MTEGAYCPSCQSKNIQLIGPIPNSDIFAGHSLDSSFHGGDLYLCYECELQFRSPILDKKQFDQLYMESAEDNWQQKGIERDDWTIAINWIKSQYRKGRILDVGCFDGEFLTKLGSNYELNGIEISKRAAAKATHKGINIVDNNFYRIENATNLYDIVVAFDVIEHVSNPIYILKAIAKLTHKSGVVIISTGNSQAFSWRLLKNRYWYCAIPEHISFISPDWCKKHALNCGLNLESVEFFSHASKHRWIIFTKIKQTIVNLIYIFCPSILMKLRKLGFGGKDVSRFTELLYHPPSWATSRDHFIVKFRKV